MNEWITEHFYKALETFYTKYCLFTAPVAHRFPQTKITKTLRQQYSPLKHSPNTISVHNITIDKVLRQISHLSNNIYVQFCRTTHIHTRARVLTHTHTPLASPSNVKSADTNNFMIERVLVTVEETGLQRSFEGLNRIASPMLAGKAVQREEATYLKAQWPCTVNALMVSMQDFQFLSKRTY